MIAFTQGQSGAIYAVTVINGSGAAVTNGTVTVTENRRPALRPCHDGGSRSAGQHARRPHARGRML